MNLKLIKTLNNCVWDFEDDTQYNLYKAFKDSLYALEDEADLLRYYMKDGFIVNTTKINFNGGLCDCCSNLDKSKIIKIEGYKIYG